MSKTATSCGTLKWSNLPGDFSRTFMPMPWNGPLRFDGDEIWTDGTNFYYGKGLVLNKETLTWETKTWNGLDGLTGFDADCVWTDGTNIYYSDYDRGQYVLNGDTWEVKTWGGTQLPYAPCIWTDGVNFYDSSGPKHYVLNKETDTWEYKENWSVAVNNSVMGDHVWTDGTNIYSTHAFGEFVLNKETDTWEEKTWTNSTGMSITPYGTDIWTDGTNIYYSDCYRLNKETNIWEYKENLFNGLDVYRWYWYIWTDGTNIYFSYDDGTHRVLCPTTTALYQCVNGEWVKISNIV